MSSVFHHLSRSTLSGLATGLKTARIKLPCHQSTLIDYVPTPLLEEVAQEINALHSDGMTTSGIAHLLTLLKTEREIAQRQRDAIDLVWTGEEVIGAETRDTSVVVQELFSSAKHSILISSYALDGGKKAQELFRVLANRMDTHSSLQVRMFFNVKRPHRDQTPESTILREFAETFRNQIWLGNRLPEVFHDPRSLSLSSGSKACLHAKCVVVDDEKLLVTSANFTEAAHQRNIEAGVLLSDSVAARAMRTQFESLVSRKILCRIPGL